MSNKKRKTSNVKSSILILLLIAILLIASTYAWFTANKTVTISTLDVHVEAANGLQISADGSNWKAILENSDITPGEGSTINTNYPGNTNQISKELNPVSTVDSASDGKLLMYTGSVEGDATEGSATYGQDVLTTKASTEKRGEEGDFVAFDIFLKVDKDTDIVLTKASDVKSKDTDDRGLKNAARVGFIVAKDADVKAAGTAISEIQNVVPSAVHIWEPNNNVHTTAAVSHGISNYGFTASNLTTSTPITSYYGVKAAASGVALNSSDSSLFAQVTPEYKTPANNATAGEDLDVFSLKQGITKVRVYLWVEGQDIDCENSASGANISFDIQFQVKENTTP